MANQYGPRIVTDGLVLYLDAGNSKSYPGSGTTWYDLSGNNNNAILNGNASNPTWNSAGYWNFTAAATGINAGMVVYNSSSLANISTSMTVELVFTLQTKTLVAGDIAWMALFSRSSTRTNQTPAISINQTASTFRYLHIERPTAFNSSNDLFKDYTGNKWYHVVAALGSTSYGYLNASQVSTSAGGVTSNTYDIYLGFDSSTEMFKGKMAIVRVYNKQLSVSDITNNYYALKGRFGL